MYLQGRYTRHVTAAAQVAAFVLLVLAMLSCGGCSEQYLRVVAEPPGSHLSVTTSDGKLVEAANTSPLKVRFDQPLSVKADPPAGQENSWEPSNVVVDRAKWDSLPAADNDKHTRELKLSLTKKEFAELLFVELVLDPHGQVQGLLTRSRAYFDTAEAGGAVPRRVVDFGDEDFGIQGLSLSPTGDRIVYSVASFGMPLNQATLANLHARRTFVIAPRGCNLQAVALRGAGIQQITSENFNDMFPAFTADGKNLLMSSNRRRQAGADLLMISALGRSGVSNIFVDPRNAMVLRPSIASDGTMAFAYYAEPGNVQRAEVWTLGGTSRFPTQVAKGSQPMISPNGDKIAYVGTDGNLWVTDVSGGNQVQLTGGASEIRARYIDKLRTADPLLYDSNPELLKRAVNPYSFPSWSTDGQYILYTGMEGLDSTGRPNEDVWIMRADGSLKQQLTTNGSADRYPLMSPDMKNIYFMSNRGGHWGIWSIDAPPSIRESASKTATVPGN